MFTINRIQLMLEPVINRAIDHAHFVDPTLVDFFDKDGYELTRLEQEFYRNQGFNVVKYTADHPGVFYPWIDCCNDYINIDHSCAMLRCEFIDEARYQIEQYKSYNYRLGWLLTSKKKYGLDLNIDYCDREKSLEVVHLEWDSYNIYDFELNRIRTEEFVQRVDWIKAANTIYDRRDEWQNLPGWYAQAHWKAKYFGLERPWY